jgi:hypothetical protein
MGTNTTLWRRWTVAATLGELVGFLVPAVVAASVRDLDQVTVVAALVVAGFVEGSALGYAQSRVMREVVPGVRRRDWTVATGTAAALAWLLGMLPSSLAGRIPEAVLWTVIVVAAPVLLASIGGAQWLVIRRRRRRSGWWVAATAAAWAAGLLVFVGISSPLWRPGQDAVLVALIGVVAGAAMAVTTAALTGLAVVRLARAAAEPSTPPLGRDRREVR